MCYGFSQCLKRVSGGKKTTATTQMYTVMIIDVKQHTQTNVNILLNILQR